MTGTLFNSAYFSYTVMSLTSLKFHTHKRADTYQSDEHPVEPAQHIGPVLQLGAVHHQARHHYSRRLLVEARRYVVQAYCRVAPTERRRQSFKQQLNNTLNHLNTFLLELLSVFV